MQRKSLKKLTGGNLDYSDRALFVISRNLGLAKSRVRALNFRRVKFMLFKELLDEIPWKAVLRDKGIEQCWKLFVFLRAKDPYPPVHEVKQRRQETVIAEQE